LRLGVDERSENHFGAVAQLGEHLLCKQGVTGSIPVSSTSISGGSFRAGKTSRG
jgi:hypothetical protein